LKKILSILIILAFLFPYLTLVKPVQAQPVQLISITPDRDYLYPGETVNITIQTFLENVRVTFLLRHTYNSAVVYYANTTVFPNPGTYSVLLNVPYELFNIGETTYQVLWIQIIFGMESISVYRSVYPLIMVSPATTTILDENGLPNKIHVSGFGFEEGAGIFGFYVGDYYYELEEPVFTNSSGMFEYEFYLVDLTNGSIPGGEYEVRVDTDAESYDYQKPGSLTVKPIAFINPTEGRGTIEDLADVEVYGFGFPAEVEVSSIKLCSVSNPAVCYVFPLENYFTDPDGFLYVYDLSQYASTPLAGGVYFLVVETVDETYIFPSTLYTVLPYIELLGPDVYQPNVYIWFRVAGFQPGTVISVYVNGVLVVEEVTDENGYAEFPLPVPALVEEGERVILVTDGVSEAYFYLSTPFAVVQPSSTPGKDSDVHNLAVYGYGFIEGTGVSEIWLCADTCYVFPIGDVYADNTGFFHIPELGNYFRTNMSLGTYQLFVKLDNGGVLATASYTTITPLMELLSEPSVKIGGKISIALYGFASGETVNVYLANRLIYTDTVDVDGNATFTIDLPVDIPGGVQILRVEGLDSGIILNATLEIQPSAFWLVLDYNYEPRDVPKASASYNGTQLIVYYPTGEVAYLGDYIQVTGYGFVINETVNIYIGGVLAGTARADSYGRISFIGLVPSMQGGSYSVVVEGEETGSVEATWLLDDTVGELEIEGRVIAAALGKDELVLEGSGIIRLYGSGLKPGTVFKAVLVNGTDALMFYASYIQTSWFVDDNGLLASRYGHPSLAIPFSQPGLYMVTLYYEEPGGNERWIDLPVLVIIPSEITQRLSEIEDRLSELESQLASIENRIEGLMQEIALLQGMIDELSQQLRLVNTTLNGEISLLEQRIQELEQLISELRQQLDYLNSQIALLSGNLTALQEMFNELSQQLQLVNTTLADTIEELRIRLDNALSAIQELSSRINELEENLAELNSTVNSISSDLNSLEQDVGDLNSRVDDLAGQVNTLQSNLNRLSSRLDDVSSQASMSYSIGIVALILGLVGAAVGLLAYLRIGKTR
jgi:predicted  nucleic acid-binding Zn-ribbon protein